MSTPKENTVDIVLADVVPFLPSALKKVPWYIRAALLVAIVGYGLYIILAWIFSWPLSPDTLRIYGIVAPLAGLPALGNVMVGSATAQAVEADLEAIARGVANELVKMGVRLPSTIVAMGGQGGAGGTASVAPSTGNAAQGTGVTIAAPPMVAHTSMTPETPPAAENESE